MENHISKNIWSAQTGRDRGERPQSWVRTGRRRNCGELEERSNHTEENSQRASKNSFFKRNRCSETPGNIKLQDQITCT